MALQALRIRIGRSITRRIVHQRGVGKHPRHVAVILVTRVPGKLLCHPQIYSSDYIPQQHAFAASFWYHGSHHRYYLTKITGAIDQDIRR